MADLTLLICAVGGQRIALAAEAVIEILPIVPIWRPPTLPRPLVGFVTLRGQAVAVLAPKLLFDAAAVVERVGLYAHLVHVRAKDGMALCLLLDRAEAMVTVAPGAVRAVTAGASIGECVTGEIALADGMAHIVALDRLLADGERTRIAALTAEAARRGAEWAA